MNKNYYQEGGSSEQDMMTQIVQAFQQLSPEAQQQLFQYLSEIVQPSQQAPQEQIMKMGGVRPRKNNQSQMYR